MFLAVSRWLAENASRKRTANMLIRLTRIADDWEVVPEGNGITSKALDARLTYTYLHSWDTSYFSSVDAKVDGSSVTLAGHHGRRVKNAILRVIKEIEYAEKCAELDKQETDLALWVTSNSPTLRALEERKLASRSAVVAQAQAEAQLRAMQREREALPKVSPPVRPIIPRGPSAAGCMWRGFRIEKYRPITDDYVLEDGTIIPAEWMMRDLRHPAFPSRHQYVRVLSSE